MHEAKEGFSLYNIDMLYFMASFIYFEEFKYFISNT